MNPRLDAFARQGENTGDEGHSPRGRIVLMRALERGEMSSRDPALLDHLDACLGCEAPPDALAEPLYFAPNLGGLLCSDCRPRDTDSFPLPPGTLERLHALIEGPIREAPTEGRLAEAVLRVVRSHVLAHAPGNAFPGARITTSRRPA